MPRLKSRPQKRVQISESPNESGSESEPEVSSSDLAATVSESTLKRRSACANISPAKHNRSPRTRDAPVDESNSPNPDHSPRSKRSSHKMTSKSPPGPKGTNNPTVPVAESDYSLPSSSAQPSVSGMQLPVQIMGRNLPKPAPSADPKAPAMASTQGRRGVKTNKDTSERSRSPRVAGSSAGSGAAATVTKSKAPSSRQAVEAHVGPESSAQLPERAEPSQPSRTSRASSEESQLPVLTYKGRRSTRQSSLGASVSAFQLSETRRSGGFQAAVTATEPDDVADIDPTDDVADIDPTDDVADIDPTATESPSSQPSAAASLSPSNLDESSSSSLPSLEDFDPEIILSKPGQHRRQGHMETPEPSVKPKNTRPSRRSSASAAVDQVSSQAAEEPEDSSFSAAQSPGSVNPSSSDLDYTPSRRRTSSENSEARSQVHSRGRRKRVSLKKSPEPPLKRRNSGIRDVPPEMNPEMNPEMDPEMNPVVVLSPLRIPSSGIVILPASRGVKKAPSSSKPVQRRSRLLSLSEANAIDLAYMDEKLDRIERQCNETLLALNRIEDFLRKKR